MASERRESTASEPELVGELSDPKLICDTTIDGLRHDCDSAEVFQSFDMERFDTEQFDTERVVLLPDATYPHHPSTGMVANPAVVEWFASGLERYTSLTAVDISVLCATSGEVSPETVASLLGYDEIASARGIELLHAGSPEVSKRIREGALVTVLTPRFSSPTGEPVTHARFVGELDGFDGLAGASRFDGFDGVDGLDPAELRRSVAFSLLDATYLNCGHSYRADRVFLSRDPFSIDGAISTLLGTEETTSFDGAELRRIRSELDVQAPTDAGAADTAMELGYRLYAKMSGDVIPPQLED